MIDARRISLHESGHAAIISIYGAPYGAGCKRVWATADGGQAEYVGTENLPEWLYCTVQFSGMAAERREYGAAPVDHGAADLRSIDRRLSHHDWWACWRRANTLVDENWFAIERLADALLAAGEIAGDDVRRILDSGHYCVVLR